jgi:phosphoglucosamine mutase
MLRGKGIVTTQMSNLALEHYLSSIGLDLLRAKVGDRHVVENMRKKGYNIGGEQSGHIILSDYTTTGDGIIAALQVLAYMIETKNPMSKCAQVFTPLPQLLRNVPYSGTSPLKNAQVKQVIKDAEESLGKKGRVFIRESGTEPLVRVMAEGFDSKEVTKAVETICESVRKAIANG